MSTELPIACSLTAAELTVRRAQIAELGRDAPVAAHVDGRRAALRFGDEPGVRERVERFAAAEAECCAFLTMHIDETEGEVRLSIDAPEGAEPVLAELVAAFAPPAA
jgi:hypothetical protein